MPSLQLYTYQDAIDHAIAFLGGDATALAARDARMAVLQAYRNLGNVHRWSYFVREAKIATNAPQDDGTIAYDHTGGTYERQVTLTDSTWPSWAALGEIVISNIAYQIAERKSSTVITLTPSSNPGADLAAGTEYRIQRTTYPLPIDCLSVDRMLNVSLYDWLCYVHSRDVLEREQHNQTTAQPRIFTILGDPNYFGTLAVRFYPAPDAAYQLNFMYHRMPRQLNTDAYSTGTVTTSNGSATVTGTGTAWSSKYIGCALRVASDALYVPTGRMGAHPYYRERVVVDVTDGTTLVVDQSFTEALSGVKYILSDPCDLEEHAMLSAFQRGIERELAFNKRMQERASIEQAYFQALRFAQQADSRSTQPRAAGPQAYPGRRLADMPMGEDLG